MLTDAAIKSLKLKDKPFKVTDRQGLYLLVKPNGSKLWRFKYYVHGIEKAPLAFGVYPDVSLKRARAKQEEARELLDKGIICAPGSAFGAPGVGHVRFALVPTLAQCERAAEVLTTW